MEGNPHGEALPESLRGVLPGDWLFFEPALPLHLGLDTLAELSGGLWPLADGPPWQAGIVSCALDALYFMLVQFVRQDAHLSGSMNGVG